MALEKDISIDQIPDEGETPGIVREVPPIYYRDGGRSSDALQYVIEKESSERVFDPTHPRVSSAGNCITRQTGIMLGLFTSDIDPMYSEAGHKLQAAAYERYLKIWPDTVEEVSVQTCIPGVYTHPDIVVPSKNLVIQVKSVTCWAMNNGKTPKETAIAQVMLEWHFFKRYKKYFYAGKQWDFEPIHYEILYLSRDRWGLRSEAFTMVYDKQYAEKLEKNFKLVYDSYSWGELPRNQKPAADHECGFTTKGGWGKAKEDIVCPLYQHCWGKEYERPFEEKKTRAKKS